MFENFGHWGERATRYLQELSTRLTDDDGNKNAKKFMCYRTKQFSTVLQHSNATTIARKLSRLLSMSSSNVNNYHSQFCVHYFVRCIDPIESLEHLNSFGCNSIHL